jgi:hypothetical protein
MQSHRAARCSAIAVGLLLTAHTLAANTVSIGGESKPRYGTLVDLTSGDVACYLDFKDDNGDRFSEMAEFSVCEDESVKGKRVAISYTVGSVLADSCQGNPECSESKQAVLVNRLDPDDSSTVINTELAADSADTAAYTHCSSDEVVLFNCAIGRRNVSICANDGVELSVVQYRYGKPGQKLEMTLPAKAGIPNPTVYGRTESYAGGAASWIRFRNANVAYVVYDGIGRWGVDGATMEMNGVVIEQNGKLLKSLKCDTATINNLSEAFFQRMGADPQSAEDFNFPE